MATRRWHLAPCLVTLLGQLDAAQPRRSKRSDGTLGDKAHQQTRSDHNPDSNGSVNALDVTHGPYWQGRGAQIDCALLASDLVGSGDPRIEYVIFVGRIWEKGRWRLYDGPSPHVEHLHLSVPHDSRENDTRRWALPHFGGTQPAPHPNPEPIIEETLMADRPAYIRRPDGLIGKFTDSTWCPLTAEEFALEVALNAIAGHPINTVQVDALKFGVFCATRIEVKGLNAAAARTK